MTSLRDAHDRYYKLSVHPVDGGDTREAGLSWELIADMMPEMSDLLVSVWDPFHCSCRAGEVVT